jgi:hypothetical protein
VNLAYRSGSLDEFETVWWDGSAAGTPVDFKINGGIGRSVANEEWGYAMAVFHIEESFVVAQAQHGDQDLVELLASLTPVDQATWSAAEAGAEKQRLIAIEAAMADIKVVPTSDEPLPHWILPEPWEPQWVTDKTIWSDEQRAQELAFAATRQPNLVTPEPIEAAVWYYGFAGTPEEASTRFVPDVVVSVARFVDAPPPLHPSNYQQVSGFGLDGVISPIVPVGARTELGTGDLRVFVEAPNAGVDLVLEFLQGASTITGSLWSTSTNWTSARRAGTRPGRIRTNQMPTCPSGA